MVRLALGIAALAFGTAASPVSTFVIARTPGADVVSRIETPQPQQSQQAFVAAPVPNSDLNTPSNANANQPTLAPTLFTNHSTYRGEGFVAGSTVQGSQFAKARPGVGGVLNVPIQ